MCRTLAIAVSILMAFSSAAFAQASAPAGQGTLPQSGQSSSDGLTAYGQEPPPSGLDTTALLIGGGVLIGGGALIAIIVNNNRNNDTTTPPPASP